MGWENWMNNHLNHRVAGADGPLVLVENHSVAPIGAVIYDARTDMMVWTGTGDYHNACLAHDVDGKVSIFRTGKGANSPVATGLTVPVPGGPGEPPAATGFEMQALALLERIAAKVGA